MRLHIHWSCSLDILYKCNFVLQFFQVQKLETMDKSFWVWHAAPMGYKPQTSTYCQCNNTAHRDPKVFPHEITFRVHIFEICAYLSFLWTLPLYSISTSHFEALEELASLISSRHSSEKWGIWWVLVTWCTSLTGLGWLCYLAASLAESTSMVGMFGGRQLSGFLLGSFSALPVRLNLPSWIYVCVVPLCTRTVVSQHDTLVPHIWFRVSSPVLEVKHV